jgi:hypothetical protein
MDLQHCIRWLHLEPTHQVAASERVVESDTTPRGVEHDVVLHD